MGRCFRPRYRLHRRLIGTRFSSKIRFPSKIVLSLLLILSIIYLFYLVDRNLKPTIIKIAETRAHQTATEAINRVLYEKVLVDVDYNELITVHKDSQQRITMMQANTIKINCIVALASLEIKEVMRNLQEETISIPIMQAMGSQLLANKGPRINVQVLPAGTVTIKFIDQFQQAGINQVRHILYLDIQASLRIVVPLAAEDISVSNQIAIAESIIVGQVPNTYLGLDNPLVSGLMGNRGTN